MNHRAGQIVLIGKLKSTSFGKVFSFFTILPFMCTFFMHMHKYLLSGKPDYSKQLLGLNRVEAVRRASYLKNIVFSLN
jgi:Sec-independent protein secretion pathway component TatC